MTKEQSYPPTCIDCGTQNCKFKERTYPEFCLTTHLEQEDLKFLYHGSYLDCSPSGINFLR